MIASASFEHLIHSNDAPTEEERISLQEIEARQDAELRSRAQKISELKAQIQGLEAEIVDIKKVCDPIKRVLAPIRRLPEDVIRLIFIACLETRRNPTMANTEAPVLLTQISSGMRRIAFQTPLLWAAIHISVIDDISPPYDVEAAQIMKLRAGAVRAWLRRSGRLPLRISLYKKTICKTMNSNYPDEIMDILLGCASRWQHVSLACAPEILWRIAALGAADVPLLRSFYHYGGYSGVSTTAYTSIWATSGILTAPGITRYAASFKGKNTENLLMFPVKWANLTHLSFPDDSARGAALPDGMLDLARLLRMTPRLVSCTLPLHQVDQGVFIDKIHLPHLKILEVHSYEQYLPDTPGLLAAMYTPALETLSFNKNAAIRNRPMDLIALLKRTPTITDFSMGTPTPREFLPECLQYFPLLTSLHIRGSFDSPKDPEEDVDDALIECFVDDDPARCLCPRLQYFRCDSPLYLSAPNMRRFIMRKLGQVPHLAKWKCFTVTAHLHHREGEHICDEIKTTLVGTGISAYLHCRQRAGAYYVMHKLAQGLPIADKISAWPARESWPMVEGDNTASYRRR